MKSQNNVWIQLCVAAIGIGIVACVLYFVWSSMQELVPTNTSREVPDAIIHQNLEDLIDMRSVEPDLQIPELESGAAAAGKRVIDVVPEYSDTNVYHVTYLPVDWEPGKRFPVIIEYAGNGSYQNKFGDVCTGLVEDSQLGYGVSAGREFIWVCLPYLDHAGRRNSMIWWGDPLNFDPQPTIDYCKKAIPLICEKYGGDADRILLTGFSRGAVACNFIGLHDDEIAQFWCGFVPFSHYDGVSSFGLPGLDRDSALTRLKRLGDRPQFICSEEIEGRHSTSATKAYLESTGIVGEFTFRTTGFRNHNDAWILRPSPARDELRSWVKTVFQPR